MIIKQRMFIVKWFDREPSLSSHDPKIEGCLTLGSVDVQVEFDMPSKIAIRDKKVSTLKDCIQKEGDCSQVKIEMLEDKIQQLMAIGVDDE